MTRQARLSITIALATILVAGAPAARASDLWPGAFKSYEQIESEILAVEAAHPEIVDVFSIGQSYEGRELYAAKISDNITLDEGEPEVLIDALYAGNTRQYIETQVKFEDGRQGMISADLEIRDVKTFSSAGARQAA